MLREVYVSQSLHPKHTTRQQVTVRRLPDVPSLEAVLKGMGDLPPYSLPLGFCEDGLPLVLDLSDPDSGSFLVASDDGFSNTVLVHNILAATLKANRPDEVTVHLISPHADDLICFHRHPNFKISFEPHRPENAIVLEEMVNLLLKRNRSDEYTPVHLLAIDGLDLLWQSLDGQSRLRLEWLIRQGPELGLWIFATVETDQLANRLTHMADVFQSRILGRIGQSYLARHLSGLNAGFLDDLYPGYEYYLRSRSTSFTFWMLESEDFPKLAWQDQNGGR